MWKFGGYTDEEWRAEWIAAGERMDREERERGMQTLKQENGILYRQEDPLWVLEALLFILLTVGMLAGFFMIFGGWVMEKFDPSSFLAENRVIIARWGMLIFAVSCIAGQAIYHLEPFKVWRKLEDPKARKKPRSPYRDYQRERSKALNVN